jgi:phosphatidyl-myo-inositol dimannoside synthase
VVLLNAAALSEARRIRPEVVFSAHIVVSPAAQVISRVSGTAFVQYVHGMEIQTRPRLAASALRAADVVIANSRFTASLALARGASDAKLHCIAPGVDTLDRPPGAGRCEQPTVVAVSRMDERYKGHDVLLRSLPLIRARVGGARLLVIGDGALRPAYEALAQALGVEQAVTFVGVVGDEERNLAVASSHVFAMPSRLAANGSGEGFGIAYLEAGALGLPVVGGNVAGALDAVVDGVTGLLVDPTDHVAVAEAVTGLLLNRERAEALGRAGAERAKEFAWPRIAGQVEELILSLARGRA